MLTQKQKQKATLVANQLRRLARGEKWAFAKIQQRGERAWYVRLELGDEVNFMQGKDARALAEAQKLMGINQ